MPLSLPLAATTTSDNPLGGVSDFFGSSTFHAIVLLVLFFVGVLWLALVFWTYKDAKRRVDDPVLVGVSIVTALVFPFVGALVYTILRPPEYLDDVRERELEIRAMERRLGEEGMCPGCGGDIEPEFIACPHCARRLKLTCQRCRSPLKPEWRLCPFCEAPTPTQAQQRTMTLYETQS
ncbi:MAG: hypothetical protein QOI71_2893 [Gaiellales bacterium]|jgi:hypothetical protein|nr:hypothetical protein [Gaiellales bacterium]MDX6619721.1 hypothetical protein [Gaiellales bacterium]